jgi:hypothetical protein
LKVLVSIRFPPCLNIISRLGSGAVDVGCNLYSVRLLLASETNKVRRHRLDSVVYFCSLVLFWYDVSRTSESFRDMRSS